MTSTPRDTRRAIAYVSDVILGTSGEVIQRDTQRQGIEARAADTNTDILGWYEDKIYAESLFERSGLQALLADEAMAHPGTIIVVERVWALSRSWEELKTLLARLEATGTRLESATTLWDGVSQLARQYYSSGALKAHGACAIEPTALAQDTPPDPGDSGDPSEAKEASGDTRRHEQ